MMRAVGRRIQPRQQVLRRELLEQGVDHLEIHTLVTQGKLEAADQRVLDGDAARKEDAVGRVHAPIDRTAAPSLPSVKRIHTGSPISVRSSRIT
ncbi:hypothetical protein [Thauera sp.]|uniref:hypothetical protein n=1 Tax=Thauera sp. TaxID=1905334 RepID=UPI00261A2255|nr:hypothetical protein [Thauera sp.]